MITDDRAEALMSMQKRLTATGILQFPPLGMAAAFDLRSIDGKEAFLIDVNRKGQIKVSKCTYQERYAVTEVLLRLDIEGPPHTNPAGQVLPCPHLHIYREGYGTKWAHPVPQHFTNISDLVQTFRDFLEYCNVTPIPSIQRSL